MWRRVGCRCGIGNSMRCIARVYLLYFFVALRDHCGGVCKGVRCSDLVVQADM
jgi:hypothetical protein